MAEFIECFWVCKSHQGIKQRIRVEALQQLCVEGDVAVVRENSQNAWIAVFVDEPTDNTTLLIKNFTERYDVAPAVDAQMAILLHEAPTFFQDWLKNQSSWISRTHYLDIQELCDGISVIVNRPVNSPIKDLVDSLLIQDFAALRSTFMRLKDTPKKELFIDASPDPIDARGMLSLTTESDRALLGFGASREFCQLSGNILGTIIGLLDEAQLPKQGRPIRVLNYPLALRGTKINEIISRSAFDPVLFSRSPTAPILVILSNPNNYHWSYLVLDIFNNRIIVHDSSTAWSSREMDQHAASHRVAERKNMKLLLEAARAKVERWISNPRNEEWEYKGDLMEDEGEPLPDAPRAEDYNIKSFDRIAWDHALQPQQLDGDSCGVFTVTNILALLFAKRAHCSQAVIDIARRRLAQIMSSLIINEGDQDNKARRQERKRKAVILLRQLVEWIK